MKLKILITLSLITLCLSGCTQVQSNNDLSVPKTKLFDNEDWRPINDNTKNLKKVVD